MTVSARKRSANSTTSGPVTANFRPFVEKGRWAAKGTLPLPEPTTVVEIFTKVILHGCRKVLFLDPKIRLMSYAVLLFFFSLVADYLAFPKTYFSDKRNVLNQYFVKFSWAWTFIFTGVFIYLTSATYCCGKTEKIVRHMLRLAVGTMVWFFWVNLFQIIEDATGKCVVDGLLSPARSRKGCLSKSGKWSSFDISGHSFLLIWCIFFITEEAKAIIGWDGIKDLIRNEEYYRSKISQGPSTNGETLAETCLTSLSDEEFLELKTKYIVYDMPAKLVLIGMTGLTIIWDLMIFMTAIYFHVMIEKVIGGLVAACTWFIVYRCIYKYVIGLPGQGLFKYNFDSKSSVVKSTASISAAVKPKQASVSRSRPREQQDDVPKFMGMPLNALKSSKKNSTHDSVTKLDGISS